MTTQSWSRSGCQGAHSPQPFCSTEFGFKEGQFPVTGLAESAHRARLTGRTSVAIPFHNHLTAEEIDYVADVLGARWGSAVGKGAGAVYEVATAAGQGARTQLCRSIYRAVLPVDFFGWPTPLT